VVYGVIYFYYIYVIEYIGGLSSIILILVSVDVNCVYFVELDSGEGIGLYNSFVQKSKCLAAHRDAVVHIVCFDICKPLFVVNVWLGVVVWVTTNDIVVTIRKVI